MFVKFRIIKSRSIHVYIFSEGNTYITLSRWHQIEKRRLLVLEEKEASLNQINLVLKKCISK